jgi:hypothetical protein
MSKVGPTDDMSNVGGSIEQTGNFTEVFSS